MKHNVDDLYRIQQDCMDIVKIAIDKMNKAPVKDSTAIRDLYQNQFININETFLRGIYNDRQRNLTSKSRRKTTCRVLDKGYGILQTCITL